MNGVERIAAERKRQGEVEKWTDAHDDEHTKGELAFAAACYAAPERVYVQRVFAASVKFTDPWPWDLKWDKRPYSGNVPAPEINLPDEKIDDRIRLLEKAGALCAAEIDRLLRAKAKKKE